MEAFHEIVIPRENIPAVIMLHSPQGNNTACELHWHESVELLASLDSRLHIICGQNEFDLMENDIALVNSSQVHRIYPLEGHAIVSLSLRLDAKIFQNYTGEKRCWFDLSLNEDARKEIGFCCRKLYELYAKEDHDSSVLLEANSLVFHIAYLLNTRLCTSSMKGSSSRLYSRKYEGRYHTILSYMEENYNKPITLDEIAGLVHLSREHLSREFSTYAGESFREHLTAIRLVKAQTDLLGSDLPLIDIAIAHGFSDLRAYNRAFRKYYGVSPAAYRQSHRR